MDLSSASVRTNISVRNRMIYDAICMALCFGIVAGVVRHNGYISLSEFFLIRVSLLNIVTFAFLAMVWTSVFSIMRVYQSALPRFASTYSRVEFYRIIKASAVGVLLIVAFGWLIDAKFIDAEFAYFFFIAVSALAIGGRHAWRNIVWRIRSNGDNARRLLVIGANPRSMSLAMQVERNEALGYQIVGFADQTSEHMPDFNKTSFKMVANLENLTEYLRATAIDEVVVCLPLRTRYDDIQRIAKTCEEQGITVGMLPDVIPFNPLFSSLQQFGDQTIMTLGPHGVKGAQAAVKRIFDVVVATALLLLLLPVFLLIFVGIRATSRGPALFKQERLGLNKKRFYMLKFRSMVVDAEERMASLEELNEAEGPVFKITNDPRITGIGKFLRKSSLDELPQLINVLRGEMSLVGPRPLTVRDYEGFSQDWHRRRFSIRPGITGLWQVSGRCDLPFDQWMQLDMQYIDQWSLGLDLKLLLLTIPAVLSGDGAE